MTVTDDDVLEYLEHFGVKGMHWGVRRAKSSSVSTPKQPKTEAEKKARRDKILKGIEIAGVVATGAIVAGYLIKKHQNTKLKNISRLQGSFKQQQRIMNTVKDVHMRDLHQSIKNGTIKPSSYDPLRKGLDRNILENTIRKNKDIAREIVNKHNASVKLANQQLKQWFNDSNVPIHAREYLAGV